MLHTVPKVLLLDKVLFREPSGRSAYQGVIVSAIWGIGEIIRECRLHKQNLSLLVWEFFQFI